MIRNTTADMQDPNGADSLLMLATAMATGSPGEFIEAQEKAGQAQLVHSDLLPTDARNPQVEFEALGFTFGEPDPNDPMFRPATLPDGWAKQRSDHDMWSYVVDPAGRRRVAIFYKAAFYDRSAHMRLTSVYEYVAQCGYDGIDLITDDTWATPAAVTTEALAAIKRCDEYIEMYSGERYAEDGFGKRQIPEQKAQRTRYAALVAQFGTEAGAL